jgi:DNA polymerase-3 subunit delta'
MTWPVIGHEWAGALLRQSLAAGRVAHAYLFAGPPQIGKTTLARTLAQALNCAGGDPPCGQCPSCRKIEANVHPDVRVVVGQGASQAIRIDQIRELQREAVLAPYEGDYRVYVLRRMDRATIEAANSLLKTLEEPPGHVVLVLTAVQVQSLPATVVSRCQRLDLRPVADHIVETSLIDQGLELPQAQLLVRLAGGRVGWALSAAKNEAVLQQRRQDLSRLLELLAADRVQRFDFAWQASRDVAASQRLIELWMGWWRDLLLMTSQGEDYLVNIDRVDELRWLAGQSNRRQAWATLKALQETSAHLEAHVNARLAWESLMLKLPRWQLTPVSEAVGED